MQDALHFGEARSWKLIETLASELAEMVLREKLQADIGQRGSEEIYYISGAIHFRPADNELPVENKICGFWPEFSLGSPQYKF